MGARGPRPRPILPGLWWIPLPSANVYVLDEGDLTLIDTGPPGSSQAILRALAELGHRPRHLRWIVLTHGHWNHAGGLAELKRATRALALMHPEDAALVRRGIAGRPCVPASGIRGLLWRSKTAACPAGRLEPHEIERELSNGAIVAGTGGLQAFHAPGHSAGELVLLWPHHGGVLIAGDALWRFGGVGTAPACEDPAEARRTLRRLAELRFETVLFGHGSPLCGRAERLRARWRAERRRPRETEGETVR